MKIPNFKEGTVVESTEKIMAFPIGTQFNVARVMVAHDSKRIKSRDGKSMHRFPGCVVLIPKGKSSQTLFSGRGNIPSLDLIENPEGEDFPFKLSIPLDKK